jgi:hypothetical protein
VGEREQVAMSVHEGHVPEIGDHLAIAPGEAGEHAAQRQAPTRVHVQRLAGEGAARVEELVEREALVQGDGDPEDVSKRQDSLLGAHQIGDGEIEVGVPRRAGGEGRTEDHPRGAQALGGEPHRLDLVDVEAVHGHAEREGYAGASAE